MLAVVCPLEGEEGMPVIDAFTVETASRLTGLSRERLGSWDRTWFFSPSLGNRDRGGVYRRVYSFLDVVALRTIARLLELGVTHQHLRKVREALGDEGNEAWANKRLYVSGNRVFLSLDEAYVATDPKGQTTDPVILNIRDIWDEVDRGVKRLSERTPEQIGAFDSNRNVLSGETVIAGTRIPARTVYEMHVEGFTPEQIMCEYPRLKREDIEAAIDYCEREARHSG
jgi:uncharacterized protein (DUF433 family)